MEEVISELRRGICGVQSKEEPMTKRQADAAYGERVLDDEPKGCQARLNDPTSSKVAKVMFERVLGAEANVVERGRRCEAVTKVVCLTVD